MPKSEAAPDVSAAPRVTARGTAIRDALQAEGGFRSAQDLYASMRSQGSRVGLSTVYRILQSFADTGNADVIRTPDGEALYRYCGEAATSGHHHHLICRQCGRAEEVEGRAIERWTKQVAADHGFVQVQHTVEIFGLCRDCATTDAVTVHAVR